MNEYLLYENAMQVVPLLLIALFLDNRAVTDIGTSARGQRWQRRQDQIIAVLGFVAFFTSMFVVSGVIDPGSVTQGIVIAALSGSIGLLFGAIWNRFARRRVPPSPQD